MNNKKLSTVKKIIMVGCAALAIISAICAHYLDDLIGYNYHTEYWDSHNLSHFGDIIHTDEDGNKLADRWVHFGGTNWYVNKITNEIKKKANNDFGSLVRLYSYYDYNENHRFNGENVSLWVYDIEPKLTELGLTRDSLYTSISKNYNNDTTNFLKLTRSFKPFLALTSGPRFAFSPDSDFVDEFEEQIVVFANNRVYSFNFANDKLKFSDDNFQVFDERCLDIVSNIDFSTYRKWETEYNKNKALEIQMTRWIRILLSIVLLSLSLFFIIPIQKLGKLNIPARNLFIYGTICFIISMVFCLGWVWLVVDYDDIYVSENTIIVLVTIGVGILYSIMMAFLSYRSNEKYYNTYLIPSWVINTFNIRSAVGERILLVALFFPLFYLFPIPIIGPAVLFYILPVSVIALIVLGIKWIIDGGKVQASSITNNDNKTTMYCRHCGKKIDADSGFCRYCGKRIK